MTRAAAVLLVLVGCVGTCRAACDSIGGLWRGGATAINVTMADDGHFTAACSAWATPQAGRFFPSNNTVWLDIDQPSGIIGTMFFNCMRINWNDGVDSVWRRDPYVGKNITIDNANPRVDVDGNILRVQDGALAWFRDRYYLYGARYQCCPVSEQPACYQPCGWVNATFAVYSSFDLQTWKLENDNILPEATDPSSKHFNAHNAYFEPTVLYSQAADHYVLWFLQRFTKAVAVSSSPTGPFEVVSWDANLPQASDAYAWTDPSTGIAYLKHNGAPVPVNGTNIAAQYVTQLTPDMLAIEPNATSEALIAPWDPLPPYHQGAVGCTEGGGIFEHQGLWFVMAGTCCCFCHAGANAFTWVAKSPLGPYQYVGDLIGFNATAGTYDTQAQQFSVAALPTAQGTVPMYIGQRFGSARDGLKCHDFQYWAPLAFDAQNLPKPFGFVDSFNLEILTAGVDSQ